MLCPLQRDFEGPSIARTAGRERKQELRAALPIEPVAVVPDRAGAPRRVGCLSLHLIGEGVVEVELRGEIEARSDCRGRAQFEVDVYRPPRVPTRVDGLEASSASGV